MISIDPVQHPIPTPYKKRPPRADYRVYPWESMRVGDSFTTTKSQQTVAAAIAKRHNTASAKRYVYRTVETPDGPAFRVWRTK